MNLAREIILNLLPFTNASNSRKEYGTRLGAHNSASAAVIRAPSSILSLLLRPESVVDQAVKLYIDLSFSLE